MTTFTTYAPRVAAHPTRTGAYRGTAGIRLLIVHTSEGGELSTSAEALAGFISTPRTSTNLASYHYIADTDRVIPIVPDDYVAYANAGANHDGLSICYPGKAGQTLDQWRDTNSAAMHEQVARWLVDKSAEYSIPLRRLSVAEVKAGVRGVCGHNEVSLAFRLSTHTDPGWSFPWNDVLNRAIDLATPPPPAPTIQIPTPPDEGEEEVSKLLVRAVSGRMFLTDLMTYAHYCTEQEGASLRDNRGAVVGPDRGPWPLNAIESAYVERMAAKA